jgi:hypothetical protein
VTQPCGLLTKKRLLDGTGKAPRDVAGRARTSQPYGHPQCGCRTFRTLKLKMPYLRKVVLHCPKGYRMELDALVEQFIVDGVAFVGVVGEDCSRVEDIIDELVVGDGSDQSRFILTSAHPRIQARASRMRWSLRGPCLQNIRGRFSLLSFNRSVKSGPPTASAYFRR